jgi:hypothetical protein
MLFYSFQRYNYLYEPELVVLYSFQRFNFYKLHVIVLFFFKRNVFNNILDMLFYFFQMHLFTKMVISELLILVECTENNFFLYKCLFIII